LPTIAAMHAQVIGLWDIVCEEVLQGVKKGGLACIVPPNQNGQIRNIECGFAVVAAEIG